MYIRKMQTGRNQKNTVFMLCNGSESDLINDDLMPFETLYEATMALKFVSGEPMSREEQSEAKEIIKKADALSLESKRNRKAD